MKAELLSNERQKWCEPEHHSGQAAQITNCYHLRWSHLQISRAMVSGSLKFLSFLLIFIHFKLLFHTFLCNHLRKPTLLGVLIPSQPCREQQNTWVLLWEGKSAGRTRTLEMQQEAVYGKCKEMMEPGNAPLPSLSKKWHHLLLFAKAVNEFPFLLDSGLSGTSCCRGGDTAVLLRGTGQLSLPCLLRSEPPLLPLTAVYSLRSCPLCWPEYCKMFALQTDQGKIGFVFALHFPFSSQFSISNVFPLPKLWKLVFHIIYFSHLLEFIGLWGDSIFTVWVASTQSIYLY